MVDAAKIAKLRAKAMSIAFPEEAESFKRKAGDLMEQHGISEQRCNTPSMTSSGVGPQRQRHRAPPNAEA